MTLGRTHGCGHALKGFAHQQPFTFGFGLPLSRAEREPVQRTPRLCPRLRDVVIARIGVLDSRKLLYQLVARLQYTVLLGSESLRGEYRGQRENANHSADYNNV